MSDRGHILPLEMIRDFFVRRYFLKGRIVSEIEHAGLKARDERWWRGVGHDRKV